MELENSGDYANARAFLDKYAVLNEALLQRLDNELAHVPVDIAPKYDAEKPNFFEENT